MTPSPDAATLFAARQALSAADPALAVMDAVIPPFVWRAREGGFPGLIRLIVEQQVSTASAAAIWARLEAGLGRSHGAVTPEAVLAHELAALKGFGLSAPKARYAHAIAEAHRDGRIDLEALSAWEDEAAIEALCRLKGVGRWTAEIYLMFCAGRIDVFPAGDLALQEGLRLADSAADRPTEKALLARSQLWRPYRAVAAHLIWAYYAHSLRVRRAAAHEMS